MSGVYDLTEYTSGYWNEDVYYNSPMHYVPNLADHNILEQIRRSGHIHLFSGVAHTKIRILQEGLPVFFTEKISGMNLISGDMSGATTGPPGGRFYHITWEPDFDLKD